MVVSNKIAGAMAVVAVALSFCLYAFAFEPFGVAEFAYVFAIPAILACKVLFVENKKRPRDPSKPKPFLRAYLAAAFAGSYLAWVWLLVWLRHVYPPSGWLAVVLLPLVISSLFVFPWFAALPLMLPKSSEDAFSRLLKLAGLAGLWVLLEWVRSWIFTGFPWLPLGNSQWTRIASIQSASWGGVWIISFTLVFFNLAVAEYGYRVYLIQRKKFLRGESGISKFAPEFYAALLLVFASMWTYVANLPRAENETKLFRAGLVQPDFAGILKWDDSLASENFGVVNNLSSALAQREVDVILLPEAATPPRYPINLPIGKSWIESLAKRLNTPILTCNMTYDIETRDAENGAFFVSEKTGVEPKYYAKQHLVPFGEYVPAPFAFLGKVVPVGNLKRGEGSAPVPAKIRGKGYKVGVMICYEDVFAPLGRAASENADMLFVCTNDSWYGTEAGAWQHASHSAIQAVANRKILLRSSNNGLSAVFDQYGRMLPCTTVKTPDAKAWRGTLPIPPRQPEISDEAGRPLDARTLKPKRPSPMTDENGSIYFRGCGYADVISYKNFGAPTFYQKYGDWVVWASAVLFALGAFKSRKKSLK